MKFEKVLGSQVKKGDKIIDNNVDFPRLVEVAKVTKNSLGNSTTVEDVSGITFLIFNTRTVLRLVDKEVLEVHWLDLKVGDALTPTKNDLMDIPVLTLGHTSLEYMDYGTVRKITLDELKKHEYTGEDLKFNVVRKVSHDIQTRIG